MISGIDHIGVFVANLEQSVGKFCKSYGLPEPAIVDVPDRRKKYAVIQFGDCSLELLEDYDPSSPYYLRVTKEGSFIHHFALRATDVDEDVSTLEEAGNAVKVGLSPKVGLRGKPVQFIKDKALALDIEITQL
jgi:catechol 2,3-dioxygenase-like lactoylglutathione lyase family enzyme